MQTLHQSPADPAFVQDPYPFYDRARAHGPFFHWADYGMTAATSYSAVNAILRDRRFGRETPPDQVAPVAAHLAPFDAVEKHSLLALEPPSHTRLRGLVLRAFTARRIGALAPEITQLTHDLIDAAPEGDFDLLKHFGQRLPVIVIARLLGVPETMSDDLLRWSNAMVAMYVAGPTRATEVRAATAAADFADFLRAYVAERRTRPADDLITHLIAAEAEGEKLTTDELVGTCILLLNAGHEATVHTIGNGVKTLLAAGIAPTPDTAPAITEEILRYDPPLHLFTRYAYDDIEVQGQLFPKGSQVALLLAAANRDPHAYDAPAEFRPDRAAKPNLALGAGLHFCVGAPLARLELNIALPILFARLPGLCLTEAPVFGNVYHFHGLQRLMVARA